MLPEDLDSDVEIWPDNELAVLVFLDLGTQWRHGMNGITGLDYCAIPVLMDLRGIAQEDRRDVFAGVKVMERAVLELRLEQARNG